MARIVRYVPIPFQAISYAACNRRQARIPTTQTCRAHVRNGRIP